MSLDVLHVNMFGKFTLSYADRQISCSGNRSKLIWNILAYLLCHRGEWIPSEDLITILWQSDKNGNPAGAMRTAIHRARQMLSALTADRCGPFLLSKNGGYQWNPDVDVVVDIDLFEERISALQKAADEDVIGICMSALDLYQGKFLEMQSSQLWVMPLQVYYQNQYELIIDRILPALESARRFDEGISIFRSALQIDPYSEKMYRHLMHFLLLQEDRQAVIHVYEDLRKMLLATFNVMPDQQSSDLYRKALGPVPSHGVLPPDDLQDQLCEHGVIDGAIICDYNFFRELYQAQARTVMRSGIVIHTALLTLKSRKSRSVSAKSLLLAMDNLEEHMRTSLRKGDVIARCSTSQFILMLPTANFENSCMVCQRLIDSFEKKYPHSPVGIDYFVQPLIPSTDA